MMNNISSASSSTAFESIRTDVRSDWAERGSVAPATSNVTLTTHAKGSRHPHARREDCRIISARRSSPEDLLPSSQNPHAKAGRARSGPKRVDAAEIAERGKHSGRRVLKAAKQTSQLTAGHHSIFEFPSSEGEENGARV